MRNFDLLGDPIPENHGGVGASGHIARPELINKVRTLVLCKWTAAAIAVELGISVPTLNKHYFRNTSIKRARKHVISEARGRVMLLLEKEAVGGNVSAIKELGKIIDKVELEVAAENLTKAPPKQKKLGKKVQAVADAESAAGKSTGGIMSHLPDYHKERPN